MSVIVKLVGFLLIIFAGYSLFTTFQGVIFGELLKTQTPDYLDFLVSSATPQISEEMMKYGIVYGVIFLVGLVMLAR